MRRKSPVYARLGAAVAGLAVGLLLAELGARMWSGVPGTAWLVNGANWYDTRIFRPDTELGQVLEPGAEGRMRTPEFDTVVRIGAQGTRGADVGAKPDGTLRVLAVGDSFTLAVQVEEQATFCAGLARRLSGQLGRPVEVVNAGVDGYGTFEASRVVSRLAPTLEVDLVLLVFFLGNDLNDNRDYRAGAVASGAVALPTRSTWVDRVFAGSALYWHATALWRARARATDPGSAGRFRSEIEPFVRGAALGGALEPTRRAMEDLGQRMRVLGLPLVVALAPPAFVVNPARARSTFALFGVAGEPDLDALAASVGALVPDDTPVVDLSGPLREAEPEGRTYFVFDGHWTPHGHATVVDALAPAVASALVPAER